MRVSEKQSFLHGAAVLAVAGIAVKIIGAFYKIPLGSILGPVGMANFSVAYNIYALLFVLSTAGVPVAVSKLVAESLACGRVSEVCKIYRVSYLAFVSVGAAGFVLMFVFAKPIATIMGNADAAAAIRAISPAVLFVSMSAINRGYFQGQSNMYPTAISEVAEASGKLVFGIGAAWYLKTRGFSDGMVSAGAVCGVSAGALLSALYFAAKRDNGEQSRNTRTQSFPEILLKLIKLSVPITLGAAVISLTNVIDSALVMNLLGERLFSRERAKWLFGAYNYATTLFNLPSALVATLSASLIPTLSGALAKREFTSLSKGVNTGIKLAMMLAVPASFGMSYLSEGIIELLYGGGIDAECIAVSGKLLAIVSAAIAPLCLVTVTSSVHQAMGSADIPVKAMLCGCVVKIISNLVLVSDSDINIYGAAWSTVLCYFTIAVFNVSSLKKYSFIKLKKSDVFLAPLFLGIVTFCAATVAKKCAFSVFDSKITTVLAVASGAAACVACAFLTGIAAKDDFKVTFKRKKVSKFLNND
ncbi:MAG: polysaccharide biosynthesis protein [Oscillospiraceae bacterium]|nr:polysaccharide biosynthesis protein [Oscillospiraceae bacterium]